MANCPDEYLEGYDPHRVIDELWGRNQVLGFGVAYLGAERAMHHGMGRSVALVRQDNATLRTENRALTQALAARSIELALVQAEVAQLKKELDMAKAIIRFASGNSK